MPPFGNGSSTTSSTMYAAHAIYTPATDSDRIIGGTDGTTGLNYSTDRRAMPYIMPEDGTIHSVTIYHDGGSDDMLLAVYSDDSGLPDEKLAVTDTTAVDANEGWQTIELTSPIDVNEGDTIWLAWVFETNPGIRGKDDSPNNGRAASTQGWASGMPADFGSSTTSSWIYSIYASYTPDQQDQAPELIGNPYMFTGRRFDLETGLYYYRARYYNPEIGRFLQTDPIGYSDGMNWYNYCGNNPVNCVDPYGNKFLSFSMSYSDKYGLSATFVYENAYGTFHDSRHFYTIEQCLSQLYDWETGGFYAAWPGFKEWKEDQAAWELAYNGNGGDWQLFWEIYLLQIFGVFSENEIEELAGQKINFDFSGKKPNQFDDITNTIHYNRSILSINHNQNYDNRPPITSLAHELDHAYVHHFEDPIKRDPKTGLVEEAWLIEHETEAVRRENKVRYIFFKNMITAEDVYPRVSYRDHNVEYGPTAQEAWDFYFASEEFVMY